MPFKCCVPSCKGNYSNGPHVSVFKFPKDINLLNAWKRAICREDFTPSSCSRVCELHFKDHQIERTVSMFDEKTGQELTAALSYPRLVAGAIPSQLPGCPSYLSKDLPVARESPESKRCRLENNMLAAAITSSVESDRVHTELHSVTDITDLKTKLSRLNMESDWVVMQKPTYINFLLISEKPQPQVKCHVHVDDAMRLTCFCGDVEVKKVSEFKLPMIVNNINQLESFLSKTHTQFTNKQSSAIDDIISLIVDCLEWLSITLPDRQQCLSFMKEQISLLNIQNAKGNRYSCDTILLSGLLYSISPHCYKFLRSSNNLLLPHPYTVKRVCSNLSTNPSFEQNSSDMLSYISSKVNFLAEEDKTVTLMVDEIHIKQHADYKGGNVVGRAFNSVECARSACVFMIQSLLSPYKDVVHILPVKTLKASDLFNFLRSIILGLENIGFEVLCIVSDNNSVNRKAVSLFADPPNLQNQYPHPKDATRPLFFIIDSVHIVKCVRNNWLNQKHSLCMNFPDFDETDFHSKIASFNALKQMHASEKGNLLKFGYSLTLKALNPTPIERQNVKLALQVFNENAAIALRQLGPIKHFEHWEDTATYIEILCKWWDIVNVKTLLKGRRLNNSFQG